MPTDNIWLDKSSWKAIASETQFSKKVKLESTGLSGGSVNDFCNYLIVGGLPGFGGLDDLYTEPLEWLQGLTYYPFDVNTNSVYDGVKKFLRIGTAKTTVKAEDINFGLNSYYTLGEILIPHKFENFADYDGYTKIRAYLPYYGYVDIKATEVVGKYVQFRLYVDYNTGQAQYIIATSENSIEQPVNPIASDDEEIDRILSTHICQIGVNIPLSQTNGREVVRDIILSAVKVAGTLVGGYVAGAAGAALTGHKKTVLTERNPLTGKQITTSTKTVDTYRKADSMSTTQASMEVFNSSINALSSMATQVQSDIPNNTCVSMCTPKSIHVVIYRPKILPVDDNYNHLYGQPLGEVRILSELVGYTEISKIHFEGEGFNQATSYEYSLIEQAFSDGIIL